MNTKEILLGLALGLFAALLVTGCEEKSAPPIVVQPQVVIPTDCQPSKWDDDAEECREIATGRITINECCGRSR